MLFCLSDVGTVKLAARSFRASWLSLAAICGACTWLCVFNVATGIAQEVVAQEVAVDTTNDTIDLGKIVEPASHDAIVQAIDRGIDFLIANQNPNGSWGSATRTKDLNIYAPVPGAHHAFRAATTALCLITLCEQEKRREDVSSTIEKGQQWLLAELPGLRRATRDAIYNVWGHGYGIHALVKLHERTSDEKLKVQLTELIQLQFERLTDYESVDGGWGYYDFEVGAQRPTASSTSFVNATILVAFHEAKKIGLSPPERLTRRAVDATLRQQKPDFSYFYGEYLKNTPMREINRPGGSLGRSQACNVALRFWGDDKITDEVLSQWLDRMIRRHGWLDIGRKRPIPHESWMQVAGYFFYYGHYYAALCLEQLPVENQRHFAPHLAQLIIDRQETDGSWWDYPLYNYHPPYGTSFAVMSLERYRKASEETPP
jgi:hypothetical protein